MQAANLNPTPGKSTDVDDNDFYDNINSEIQNDLTRLKKNVTLMINLRLSASEMEVEIASLYHAQLWYEIEEESKKKQEKIQQNLWINYVKN